MRLWRERIKPIMEKTHEGMAAFDPEAFEAALVAVHDEVRGTYLKQKREKEARGKHRRPV